MKEKIRSKEKDPLGCMMLDYLDGVLDARVKVESTTLEMWEMTGRTMFRTYKKMAPVEQKALQLCKGRVLDIGAGSGCHSLYLQKKGMKTDALDYSPGCVAVMKKRRVENRIHDNLFAIKDKKYDTILMLMNGLGIVGSLDGLNLFFQHMKPLLSEKGQIVADSTDLALLYDPDSLPSGPDQSYYGETCFTMAYKNIQSAPFDWLYIDFDTLAWHAGLHGFHCEKIMEDKTGKYLVRIYLQSLY